ncbi:polysaccharide biosynthesis/export family protein [Rubellimicrobium roseum]|nr:polysaccharide biosynthesis/export family protein [Rubellimicrobium roseum]
MPIMMLRLGLGAALGLALAGCNLPRGAGLESEVLGMRSSSADPAVRDFAVEPVTRAALPVYAAWPRPGEEPMGWLERQDGPANRVIAPGDVLAIRLWTNEANSLLAAPGQRAIAMDGVTVSSTGSVFMPYVGNVKVSGMSPDRAREVIEAQFVEVSPSAQVQLEVAESTGTLVSLVGGVQSPGTYPMRNQSYTVLSLIAEGGGVIEEMNNPQIRLIRGDAIYGTSIDRLFSDPRLDTTLRPGDKVIVEPDERFFLSLGAAGREARHPFPTDQMNALEALSIIGGLNDARGNPKGILILRNYPLPMVGAEGGGPTHERVVFTLDLTTADGLFSAGQFPILSGDLVYATESPLTAADSILAALGTSLGIASRARGL